ncbi:polar amino acid transport system permease protein [Paraburkholderia sp. BL6669N2]|uniref:amino acid ABC transporter permease n=1 Tax=unclassified Paraburkholderia TaxID=2615204 RepID=UPI000D061FE5|nr:MULTISPECIES: amino acid ABC transporter permease [unclassified Paraburkholderia]PRX19626.1 polar amino acid transport system permease protein [Paraburkholderia sp. BL18I3N2]PRX95913.1 amino acid ABC transporter membrane protein 1 (PAAT family) [Paraburkholderia sp. BL25I1N1]REG58638.1 polar amino acid transport system permease protein [Paraburkholderia sp. BL6669N2]TDY15647.1 amino acid ABC transporter membrane protein 1 (PAAT family) [Paraburkholderia sp. BL6665CI2N2]
MTFPEVMLAIYKGFGVTATVTIFALLYAIPFALVGGVLQHFSTGFLRKTVTAVIELWRSSPVIVLLYAFYYSLPAFGIFLSGITVGALVLGMNSGAYSSQAVRAALQSLSRGQCEAGLALGLNRFDVLRLVELPQAIRAMIPTFINDLIQLMKGTALVSLITLSDMTFRAKEISQLSYNPLLIYSSLLLAYLIICYPVTIFGRYLERFFGTARSRT